MKIVNLLVVLFRFNVSQVIDDWKTKDQLNAAKTAELSLLVKFITYM